MDQDFQKIFKILQLNLSTFKDFQGRDGTVMCYKNYLLTVLTSLTRYFIINKMLRTRKKVTCKIQNRCIKYIFNTSQQNALKQMFWYISTESLEKQLDMTRLGQPPIPVI